MRSGARKRSVEDFKRLGGGGEEITLGAPLRSSSQEPNRRRRNGYADDGHAEMRQDHTTTTTTSSSSSISGSSKNTSNNSNNNNDNNNGFSFGSHHPAKCLTRELQNLEPIGQQEVTQDIYGIDVPNAKAYFNQQDFDALQQEINNIHENKEAYLLAEEMSFDFVHNPKFRILFLRAGLGNFKKAAKRLVRHFKTKLNLFGRDKLVQEITLNDLSEDDLEALRSGGFQVLPKPDRAGRSILFGRYTCFKYKEPANMIRSLWYLWMTLLEDETNQIKGVTAVGYEIGRSPLERYDHDMQSGGDFTFEMSSHGHGGFDRDLAKQITTIPLSVPVRPVGYHLCADSDQWVATLNMVVATICKFMRLRMRLHHGSDQECKYQLMTHGIPADLIPVEPDGSVNLDNHWEWIEQRRVLEAQRTNTIVDGNYNDNHYHDNDSDVQMSMNMNMNIGLSL